MRKRLLALTMLALATSGCRTGRNYPMSEPPRYVGASAGAAPGHALPGDTLRVGTFNIEYALEIDSAIAVLKAEPAFRDADVLLLQEMDADATRRVAEAMGMSFVYYPATFHLRNQRDFGNAVLSRHPIVADARIVLPHVSRFIGTERTATAATIQVGDEQVRVYSTHLGTIANVGPEGRRDQLRAILEDANTFERVIIGGDMNNASVGKVARERGYAWPTERGPRTTILGRIDHIFFKGFFAPDSATGTVLDVRHSSDHRPVWALAVLR